MPSHPKSRIKIKLDDDPTTGLRQSASLPGTGAGKSSIRDQQDILSSTRGGVKVLASPLSDEEGDPSITPKPDDIVLAEAPGVKVIKVGERAFNIVGPSAGDYVFYKGALMTNEQFAVVVGSASGAEVAGAGGGFVDVSGTGTGDVRGPVLNLPSGGEPSPTDDTGVFDLDAFLKELGVSTGDDGRPRGSTREEGTFDILTPAQQAFQDIISRPPSKGTTLSQQIQDLLDSDLGHLIGVATQTITPGFINLLNQPSRLLVTGQFSVGFGIEEIVEVRGGRTVTTLTGVFKDLKTGTTLMGADGKPLVAPGAKEAIQAAEDLRTAILNDLSSSVGVVEDPAGVKARQTKLETLYAAEAAAVANNALRTGERVLAVLQSELVRGREQVGREFTAEENKKTRDFQAGLANTEATNLFKAQALDRGLARELRIMELSWINGSPEEARAARLRAQDIANRQIQLQERELLVSTLAILGQHPQLRGLIASLGIFDGQTFGGDFDLGAFFSGNLPLDQIPSAQEFSLMTPAQQENLLNQLAGKFGMSSEIIAATIREQAPISTRRLV